jgi:3-oxoacyl-[acyl-carrier-protein] synthase II
MNVVVTGIGCQTALGNLEETWRGLLLGRSGIKIHQPFSSLPAYPLALIGDQPQYLSNLVHPIVQSACRDAGLTTPLRDCAVVLGSSRGNQARWEQILSQNNQGLETEFSEGFEWLEMLPNFAAVQAARWLQTSGEVHAPMAACATGLVSIAQAFRLIQEGVCDRVIAGAIDAPVTPLTLAGFGKMGALAKTGCYPFDLDREGFVLGEGGAVLVLESLTTARSRGAKIYGEILGASMTADAFHLSAPEPTGRTAMRAIKQCLEQSQRRLGAIDYIQAHGTGTRLNDARESQLIQTWFPNAAVSSSKGAIGHTLGASGAIGAAICLKSLQTQTLSPTVGLSNPEYSAIDWVVKTRQQATETVLCFGFGFGGQNAAIALGRIF